MTYPFRPGDFDDEDDLLSPEDEARIAKVAREMLAEGDGDAILRRYAIYKDNPCGFFVDVLGIVPWESEDPKQHGQADLIRSIGQHDQVACKSGHKIGKSITAVGLSLWWICTRKKARVQLTAPTFAQVKNILWKEFRNIYRERNLRDKLTVDLPLDPATGLQLPNGNEIIGISTKTKENLAGFSGGNLMFIVDEASGFPDDLWEVISSGNSAGGAKIFVISNPTRTSGWFFELFRKKEDEWVLFTISSENTPNVRAGVKLVDGLAALPFILKMRKRYGPDYNTNATYMVRVRGEFPPQGTDVVIGAAQLERAVAAWKPVIPNEAWGLQLTIGVDCARYGDDANVLQPVRGSYAYLPREVNTSIARNSTTLTAGKIVADAIVELASELRHGSERVRVNLDGIGVGASVVDALKLSDAVQQGWIYTVDLNVGEKAEETLEPDHDGKDRKVTHYNNLRSQVWFVCSAWIQAGGMLPDHDALQRELLAATYCYDEKGRKKVDAKENMRSILGNSPDHADALCMATYQGSRGTWTEVAYDAVPDHRHAAPKAASIGWADEDDDDDVHGKPRGFTCF